MTQIEIVDVIDQATFDLIPPCADPGFDHRTCDYWEDAQRGSKAARAGWLEPPRPEPVAPKRPRNPFDDADADAGFNPFAPARRESAPNPFLASDGGDAPNPFAPAPAARPRVTQDAPRKLGLLARGLGVFGSYAKVLLVDGVAAGYTQFGPLSAYPRALRLRELYPQLPDAPLPAVITCIATTAESRRQGHALRLVTEVCDDLAARGFAAVETYPARGVREDATSAAFPDFWRLAGFVVAVDDERFPVMRREL